jgi:putative membrane protein
MGKPFLSDDAKDALVGSIRAVEARSSAEVVIAVRARSASYHHADFLVGSVCAVAALAFVLFSPWPFSLASILIDPIVVGAVAGFVTSRIPEVRRMLTPPRARERSVQTGAKAAFYDKGVRMTRDRTGLLVYVSLLERDAAVIVDKAVQEAVDAGEWQRAVEGLRAGVARGEDGVAVARRIESLGDLLEPALPRAEDDINELADEVHG